MDEMRAISRSGDGMIRANFPERHAKKQRSITNFDPPLAVSHQLRDVSAPL